ncbi:MAG: TonB-dependent receptor, partial [Novosphingobium sp.]
DTYAVRGTLRFEPTDTTTIDLLASYSRENDNRLRIQKQQCQRDPTGVLGCLNGRRDYGTVNLNATIFSLLTSRELLGVLAGQAGINPAGVVPFGLGSIYGTDAFAGVVNPADKRVINSDYRPSYFSDEQQYQARIEQDLGSLKFQLTGFYHTARVDSSQDYTQAVQNRGAYAGGLATLSAAAAGAIPGLPAAYFAPIAAALIPGGPNGTLCTSLPEETGTGVFGGNALCSATPQDFDRSVQRSKDWSVEGILTSDFDGPFNFLLGGIYVDQDLSENSYFVNGFPLDYASGIVGTLSALARAGVGAIPGATVVPPSYLATPFFRNNTDKFTLKSYGIFGEAYYEFNDQLKLTLGARYNDDRKTVRARSTLGNFLVPFGSTDAFASPFALGYAVTGAPVTSRLTVSPFGALDADPATTCTITSTTPSGILTAANVSGCEPFQVRKAKFTEWTGRAVLDWQVTSDNLLYASYSRGYKSGGINPPLQAIFQVSDTFDPELIDAFEIGSKNVFGNGELTLNLTGFYYKYKKLQLSRIVARTSVNDNVDADIYGLEAEAIVRPIRNFVVNLSASYLHTKVNEDKFLTNPRDPGGGRADAVIIKDLLLANNCAVTPNVAGNAAAVNAFVGAVNQSIGLRPPTPFPADGGIASTGAFGLCSALQTAIDTPPAALRTAFATPTGPLPFTLQASGVPVNIRGNKLPQAPTYKFSVGVQYTHDFDSGWNIVPRVDLSYTGEQQGSIFGGKINEIKGFVQANAQLTLNGPDDRWFVRGFVQNILNSDSTTGLYVSDASTGLFTNLFVLEPRRYGIGAGVKF